MKNEVSVYAIRIVIGFDEPNLVLPSSKGVDSLKIVSVFISLINSLDFDLIYHLI